MMFVKVNDLIVPESDISWIDCGKLASACQITVSLKSGLTQVVSGQPAIDLVMQLCPAMVEGKRMKFQRHMWSIHNLIAHPGLQILAWLGFYKLGFKLHDTTVPRPR